MGAKISAITSNSNPNNLMKNAIFFRAYRSAKKSNSGDLFKKISTLRDPNVSIIPVLDQWIEEGKKVEDFEFQRFIRELRARKRYCHALQVPFLFSLFYL